MITCSNCGKENADDSAHCGFCGYQLQEGAKKTMFGMNALDADAIAKATAQAKAAAKQNSTTPDASLPDPSVAKTEVLPHVASYASDSLSGLPGANSPVFPSSEPSQTGFSSNFGSASSSGPSTMGEPMPAPSPGFRPHPEDGPAQIGGSRVPSELGFKAGPNGPALAGDLQQVGGGYASGMEKKSPKTSKTLLLVGMLLALGGVGCVGAVALGFMLGWFDNLSW